jgi:hypothetical protein
MNDKELEKLQNDFAKLIRKYKLQDTLIISNKGYIKPVEYSENQILDCVFAALENILTDITIRLTYNSSYDDFNVEYDRLMQTLDNLLIRLKQRIKHRIEEVEDKNIKYN